MALVHGRAQQGHRHRAGWRAGRGVDPEHDGAVGEACMGSMVSDQRGVAQDLQLAANTAGEGGEVLALLPCNDARPFPSSGSIGLIRM